MKVCKRRERWSPHPPALANKVQIKRLHQQPRRRARPTNVYLRRRTSGAGTCGAATPTCGVMASRATAGRASTSRQGDDGESVDMLPLVQRAQGRDRKDRCRSRLHRGSPSARCWRRSSSAKAQEHPITPSSGQLENSSQHVYKG